MSQIWYRLEYAFIGSGLKHNRWLCCMEYPSQSEARLALSDNVARARDAGKNLAFRIVRCEVINEAATDDALARVEKFLRD